MSRSIVINRQGEEIYPAKLAARKIVITGNWKDLVNGTFEHKIKTVDIPLIVGDLVTLQFPDKDKTFCVTAIDPKNSNIGIIEYNEE